MRIDPIVPDRAVRAPAADVAAAGGFGRLVDAAAATLAAADSAESAFARGRGGLQEMVVERARADIMLAVATTGAQRAAQALNTLLGMQI
jgi:flagellar hook-basal body complex protein FliE